MDTKPKTKKNTCVGLLFFILRSNLCTVSPILKKHELLRCVEKHFFLRKACFLHCIWNGSLPVIAIQITVFSGT